MSCNLCVLKLLTNNELVKFIQKLGQFQVARIIEEHDIDGSKILELSRKDTLKWNLTEVEGELLWKCVQTLKLIHLTEIECQKIENKNNLHDKRWSICNIYNKYFKYRPGKKNLLLDSETKLYDYYTEYIFGPEASVQDRNIIIDKMKRVSVNGKKYELLTNCEDVYLDLNVFADDGSKKQKYMSNLYETAPIIISTLERSTIKLPPSTTKEKSRGFKFTLKLCCISCVASCTIEY